MEYSVVRSVDKDYPELLKAIKDPPEKLYYAGDISLAGKLCVAVVGSRKCSDYGKRTAMSIGERLAGAGVCVVSGMARGVDTFAHKGALERGGATIAVMGTPIDECYPSGNRHLKEQIIRKGLLLSEYPPGYPTTKGNFPRRNRIISGLSHATILAEAGLNSGALITACMAEEQGRSVYVVPSNIDNPNALGSNLLLRDGAMPLAVIDDIFDDLGITRSEAANSMMDTLEGDEKLIGKALLSKAEMNVDELCVATGLSPQKVNGIVTVMEMKGFVHTSMGKIFLAK